MSNTLTAFAKAASHMVVAVAFGYQQTSAIFDEAEALPEIIENLANPDFLGFVDALERYNWHEAAMKMGLSKDEGKRIVLAFDVKRHPRKPANFRYTDLGIPGCGPFGGGKDNPHHGATACHAVLTRDEKLKPGKKLIPGGGCNGC